MYHFFVFVVLALIASPILIRLIKIIPNYIRARSLDLPIYVSLFTWQDPIWTLIHSYFLSVPKWLPFPPFNGIKYSYFGWTISDKGRTHLKLGNAFCVVSPHRLEIFCAEPSVCQEVMQKWKVWTKSPELMEIFNTFGENINTVNHQDWQRHRKIASQAFREETYELVWEESRKQADQLLRAVVRRGEGTLVDLRDDFALLAMHVLSSAVFGHSYDYGAGLQQVEAGHKMSYFASLAFILQNVMSVILFKSLNVPDWLLPSFLRKLKLSVSEYQQYLTEAAEQEHKAGASKRSGASLVSALVQANNDAKNEERTAGGLPMHLTDQELFGNMYIFNLAGYETTSFALSFTIPYLAIDPALQDWIQEEIDAVFAAGHDINYEKAFHRLPRCRALMFETLRQHSAVAAMPRLSPKDQPTELYFPSLNKTIVVPADSYVTTNFPALHNDPRTWGSDAYSYNPRRWLTLTPPPTTITSQTMSSSASNSLGEHLLPEPQPSKSSPDSPLYIPWLHGPRVCPGKKFSQVEFVGVVARVFWEWRVEMADVTGQGKRDRNRGRKALRESVEMAGFNLTPKLYKPESAAIRWIRREKGDGQ